MLPIFLPADFVGTVGVTPPSAIAHRINQPPVRAASTLRIKQFVCHRKDPDEGNDIQLFAWGSGRERLLCLKAKEVSPNKHRTIDIDKTLEFERQAAFMLLRSGKNSSPKSPFVFVQEEATSDGWLVFNHGRANYTLTYEVIPKSPTPQPMQSMDGQLVFKNVGLSRI